MGVEPLERGQQCGMDIEHAPGPMRDEAGREQPHEAGETDEIDAVFFQHRLNGAVERRAVLAEVGMIDHLGGDAG